LGDRRIETAIRELKDWRSLEELRSQWADGIRQEITAIMAFLCLVGDMEAEMRSRVAKRVEQGVEHPEVLEPETMPTFYRSLMGHDRRHHAHQIIRTMRILQSMKHCNQSTLARTKHQTTRTSISTDRQETPG
jgi:hypothetical protein